MSTPPQASPEALRNDSHNALRNHPPDALPEALITRVLTGLRDTQPSPCMNDRILNALQARVSTSSTGEFARSRKSAPLPAFLFPAFFREALIRSLLALKGTGFSPSITKPRSERLQPLRAVRRINETFLSAIGSLRSWPLTAATIAAALLVTALLTLHLHHAPNTTAQLIQPQPVPTAPAPLPATLVQPAHARTRASTKFSTPRALVATPSTPTDPLAAEALADTLAPSHPAPPLPLTPEEKRLLRVLQRNDPVELAQLDPVHLAASLARDQAEYRKFFTPPPPLPQNPTSDPTPAEIQAQKPASPSTPTSEPTPATPSSGDQQ